MPIVVRELIIRARVDEADCNSEKNGRSSDFDDKNTERLVALCVEKVMEALERKRER